MPRFIYRFTRRSALLLSGIALVIGDTSAVIRMFQREDNVQYRFSVVRYFCCIYMYTDLG